jgi:hypothetical protein
MNDHELHNCPVGSSVLCVNEQDRIIFVSSDLEERLGNDVVGKKLSSLGQIQENRFSTHKGHVYHSCVHSADLCKLLFLTEIHSCQILHGTELVLVLTLSPWGIIDRMYTLPNETDLMNQPLMRFIHNDDIPALCRCIQMATLFEVSTVTVRWIGPLFFSHHVSLTCIFKEYPIIILKQESIPNTLIQQFSQYWTDCLVEFLSWIHWFFQWFTFLEKSSFWKGLLQWINY